MESVSIREVTLLGKKYRKSATVESELAIPFEKTMPAAKAGALTTRTDDNTGVLTMGASHGITTGARLDLYFTGGKRRGMTVGTVSGTSVPIDGGTGDNLPADESAVTAMVPTEDAFVIDGDLVTSIVANLKSATARGTVVFADASDVEILHIPLLGDGDGYIWQTGDNTNPVAGDAIAKVFLSHEESSKALLMHGAVQYD
jgi:hypothetical protein